MASSDSKTIKTAAPTVPSTTVVQTKCNICDKSVADCACKCEYCDLTYSDCKCAEEPKYSEEPENCPTCKEPWKYCYCADECESCSKCFSDPCVCCKHCGEDHSPGTACDGEEEYYSDDYDRGSRFSAPYGRCGRCGVNLDEYEDFHGYCSRDCALGRH